MVKPKGSSPVECSRNGSITLKFFRRILPPVVAGFLLMSAAAGVFSYYDMKNDFFLQAGQNAETYSKFLGMSLWDLNIEAIDSQIQSILTHPKISGVKLVERIGRQEFLAGEVPDTAARDRYLVLATDIIHVAFEAPEVLGVLYLYSGKQQIYSELFRQFSRDFLFFAVLAGTAVTGILVVSRRIVARPVHKLAASIRRYHQHRETEPVTWPDDDEIGRAVSAYNGLIASLDRGNARAAAALEKAETASKIKGRFLADMSHEIRTPLNGIIGMADLLYRADLPAEQKTFASTIYTESESLLGIINDILDFSKIEAGKLELEEIEFDLRHTIESLCATMAMSADQKGIELIHYLESGAPTRLLGDPGRLRQVFVNLIGNAVKFTHKGEVFVKGEITEDLEREAVFRFTVKDTGVGIPEEKQGHIFDSFSQADGATARLYGGTGLGITIAKMLVEKMGGRIGLHSVPGQGTSFWFELAFLKQRKTVGSSLSVTDFKALTVFVVDDVKTNRDIFSGYLTAWGCKTVTSSSGEEALHLLENMLETRRPVDMILIDSSMPSMNNFELAGKIRSMPGYTDTPMGVLTAMGTLGDGRVCKQIGIDGYLTKPVRENDLKTFIHCVMGNSSPPETGHRKLVTRHTLAEIRRKNIRVLLVEDYESNQHLITRQLEGAGFKVTLAGNGEEAVRLFRSRPFDIVLMDIQMPVMDGYQATAIMRSLEKDGEKTPIIAMTAYAMKGNREECINAGMDDYITKPLKREVLISTVTRWIQKEGRRMPPSYNFYMRHSLQAEMPVPVQVFDLDQALDEFGQDEAFLSEVFDAFLEVVGKQIPELTRAVKDKNTDVIVSEAHSIKGGAANLTAVQLSAAAAHLEKIGRKGDFERAGEALALLEKNYQALKRFHSNFIVKKPE